MHTALAVAAALASRGALITEYNSYSKGAGLGRQVYVAAVVRGDVEAATTMPVTFNTPRSSSNYQGEADMSKVPIYLDRAAYLAPAVSAAPGHIAFVDLQVPGDDGVHIGTAVIGSGPPPKSVAHSLLATAECDTGFELCSFVDDNNVSFTVSAGNTFDVLPTVAAADGVRVGGQFLAFDTNTYNAYVTRGEDHVVSATRHTLALWQNGTHAQVWEATTFEHNTQDFVGMCLLLTALVIFVDVSHTTTQKMATSEPYTAQDTGGLVPLVVADFASTALMITVWRIVVDHGFFLEQPIAFNGPLINALVVGGGVATCAVAAGAVFDTLPSHRAVVWVWTRCAYECLLLTTAAAIAPAFAGPRFVLLFRYVVAFVIATVVGRDAHYVHRRATDRGFLTFAGVHAIAILVVTTTQLFAPVLADSKSFPHNDTLIFTVATLLTAVCVAVGISWEHAAGGSVSQQAVPRAKSQWNL